MGVGLLTKVELVVMAPVIGLSVLMAPKTALARWRAALLVAVPALPGVVWWVVQQAGGGVLSPEGSEILAPASRGPWSSANVFGYAAHKVPVVLDRFWGLYGVPAFVVPPLARALLWAGTAALVGGWLATRRWRRPTMEDARLAVLALVPLVLVFAVIWASFKTYRSNGEVRALVPRYVYPALPLMALAAVSALATTARRAASQRWARWSRWALPVGIPLLALGAGLASLLHAMRGLYGTSDASLLLDRAGAIAPLATPGPWALIILEAWAVAVAVAAVAAYNVRSGPGSSDVIEVAPRGGPGEGPGVGGQSGVGHQAEVDRLG
jgi:hypothetical protein